MLIFPLDKMLALGHLYSQKNKSPICTGQTLMWSDNLPMNLEKNLCIRLSELYPRWLLLLVKKTNQICLNSLLKKS